MTWDPTPWFVGGGATHSPEVARMLAYAATGGAEGIAEPADLKVLALAVPGGKVRALPGASLIRNRAAGFAQQSYAGRNPTEDVVDISPTTSAGGRSDLIVARVEDSSIGGQGWQPPADPTKGPYVFTRVVPNVPAGTTRLQDINAYSGHSAITLARVDIPASTATITQGMIVDLRKIARPRSQRFYDVDGATGGILTNTQQVRWPNNTRDIDIPEWATHYVGKVGVHQLQQTGGNAYASLLAALGPDGSLQASSTTYLDSDQPSGSFQRVGVEVLIGNAIPVAWRGTRQRLQTIAQRLDVPNNPGTFNTQLGSTQIEWDIQFVERIS